MPDAKGTYSPEAQADTAQGTIYTLRTFQNYFRIWANATQTARMKFRRDFEMVEGNGKQWLMSDAEKVRKSNRPVLEFNQILPQVELVAGMQRSTSLDFAASPRGLEDRRLGEIATASLKAASDFARVHRINDRVFDDGTICGLGAWEVLHSFDDAEDFIWGDIVVSRINPLAFVYDPWAVTPDRQDGLFMGKATWIDLEEFKKRWPSFAQHAVTGEWLSRTQTALGAADDLGTGPNLMSELWDQETGRIRILTLWYKVPTSLSLIINTSTGMVTEVASKDQGTQVLEELKRQVGQKAVAPLEVVSSGTEAFISQRGGPPQPIPDPQTGRPMQFVDGVAAQSALDQLSERAGMQVYDQYQVISRKARVPQWVELVWWSELDRGKSPFRDRSYPFVPYISRQFSDDPESIMGIVRNLHDPQDEYNKRYSNLLAHANSSSHSGWLNRKAGGADTSKLELMGSKPGVVVEYSSAKPEQIHPVEMSQGHFNMLQVSERNILRISGVNAEMVGQTTQQTVSGRAIRARQEGGSTILKPRFRTFEEALLDVNKMMLSRIQQYYPVEKLKRIIGVAELSAPLGQGGQSIFADPQTGQPMPDEQVMAVLGQLKTTIFDLVLRMAPATVTERQAQFEQAVQLAQLITSTGRPLGPATLAALLDLSDMPSRLSSGLQQDAAAEVQAQQAQAQGVAPPAEAQNKQIQGMQAQMRGGRAGGSEGPPSGTAMGGAMR